jgi:NADH dehydrogenase
MEPPRMVIVGAGFGGFTLARALEGKPVDVLLVDRNNYHLFTPLLYQVASSLLNPSDIAYPVRKGFTGSRNVRFRLGEVTGADLDRRVVRLGDGSEIPYDRLVLAAGSTTAFYGMADVQRAALGLKDLPEAMELRNHVLSCFESASREADPARARALLTFVIVGGGPTGVEYAGALAELIRLNLGRDFPEIDRGRIRILLLERESRLLPMFREDLSGYARRELENRSIEVRLGCGLANARDGAVVLEDGGEIAAETLVWAAGVRPAGLADAIEARRSGSGRMVVDEYLRLPDRPEVYAIGDLASFSQNGEELPMLAPPAMQQARHTAKNLRRDLEGLPLVPFRYRDKGIMATIGRKAAVAQTGSLAFRGILGWLAWLVLHLYYIISFRNRILILLQWAWEYFRYDRPIRLIVKARDGQKK